MNSRVRRTLALSLGLVALSASLYVLQVVLFPDPQAMWLGLISQLAFLPLYYLFTSVVVDRALARKDREDQLRRMNVLVGVFFNEVGDRLLSLASGLLADGEGHLRRMRIAPSAQEADFVAARKYAGSASFRFDMSPSGLADLSELVGGHRDDLLRLLQNPGLLEHESFTDLLLAVFHLCDEFSHRPAPPDLTPADISHLEGDLRRAYVLLSTQWLSYALHLKREYPYLYVLVVRTSPLGA